MTLVVTLLSAAAAVLLFPAASALPRPRTRVRPVVMLAPLAGAPLLLHGRDLMLVAVLGGGAFGAMSLHARARARQAADADRTKVIEACEVMASELRAGQPPLRALEQSLASWPRLEPVVAACRLDADVPDALHRVSHTPGAGCLSEVAAAWQLSERVGAGLAHSLDRVVDTARGELATHRVVAAELASAQATARMVAVLPVVMLVLSSGSGGDPWHFLLRTTAGIGCLAGGVGLALAGMFWIDRIVARVQAGEE